MKTRHAIIATALVVTTAVGAGMIGTSTPQLTELPNPTFKPIAVRTQTDLTSFDGCDAIGSDGKGHAPKGVAAEENPLKNRWQEPAEIDLSITLGTLLKAKVGDSLDQNSAATITGYVPFVKPGGVESCNCNSGSEIDTHIYVVADENTDKHHSVIVEITPRIRSLHPEWTQTVLKQTLEGHTVEFTGYLLNDKEHKVSSFNDNPKGRANWRQSCWEIHPVTGIRVIS